MLDNLVYNLFIFTLGSIIGGFFVTKIIKIELKKEIPYIIEDLKDQLKHDAEGWLNSETGQKALYQIGGLIGTGARSGLGLQKRGGKRGLMDVAIELGSEFLKGRLGKSSPSPSGSPPPPPKTKRSVPDM